MASEVYDIEWAIKSLDIILGLVGGFIGFLWALLSILIESFEVFKLETSLIRMIYPTSSVN